MTTLPSFVLMHADRALPARPTGATPRPFLERWPIRFAWRVDLRNLVVDVTRVAAGQTFPGDVVEHRGRLPTREGPVPCD